MANIKIRNKGTHNIYLTRYYNSSGVYQQQKDDVRFNENSNQFDLYCNQIVCGNPLEDKIKFVSLPTKGKIFYITNPGAPTPIYSSVTVGQELFIQDLINHKILKFNAEGDFNNAFTGNYLTDFKIERFCGLQSSNIITKVELNLIDVKATVTKIEIHIPQTCEVRGDGPTNYEVTCSGQIDFAFSQYLNTQFGFVRMTTDGGTSEIGLSKANGGALILNETFQPDKLLTASLNSSGGNSPGAYPWGYPSSPTPTIYFFEYSLNGIDNWESFQLKLRNG